VVASTRKASGKDRANARTVLKGKTNLGDVELRPGLLQHRVGGTNCSRRQHQVREKEVLTPRWGKKNTRTEYTSLQEKFNLSPQQPEGDALLVQEKGNAGDGNIEGGGRYQIRLLSLELPQSPR